MQPNKTFQAWTDRGSQRIRSRFGGIVVAVLGSLGAETAHAAGMHQLDERGATLGMELMQASSRLLGRLFDLSGHLHGSEQGWGTTFWVRFMDIDAAHADRCGFQGADLALLAIVAAVVITAIRSRRATIRQRLDVARSLAERGMEPPADLLNAGAGSDLHRGIVLIATGFGLLAASHAANVPGLSPAGLIPFFIGVGYLVSYRFASSRKD